MAETNLPEVWLRGPVSDVPALLQPVAHALLQAQEEIHAMMHGFPTDLIWKKPAGVASVAFHLQHITGVLDRTFTYAQGNTLSTEQLDFLKKEGVPDNTITVSLLLSHFDKQLDKAIAALTITDPAQLTSHRAVGRKQLPSTMLGLLFHAAEHTMRHVGQLLVTLRVVKENSPE